MSQPEEAETFYETFLAPMEGRMARAVWRVLRDPELVRDGLQDALATIWKRRRRIVVHPNPEALILRICIASAIDLARRVQRQGRLEHGELPAEQPSRSHSDPAAALERIRVRARVLEAIGRLPPKRAVAVTMRLVEDESYSSIAAALNCSEATARVHVMQGRAALKKRLRSFLPHACRDGEHP